MKISDVLIMLGMTAIVAATFIWNVVAGVYAVGVALLAAGIWIARGDGH